LENLGVKETPMFVAETTGAWTSSQTATEECRVKIMHIKARLLVVSVFDNCTRKTQKLSLLKPPGGASFALNSQKFECNFVPPVVSHIDTPGFLWVKTVHKSAELSYFWAAAHLVFVQLECFSFFKNKKLAVMLPQTEEESSLSCLPCL
jgi:hypothetical protein